MRTAIRCGTFTKFPAPVSGLTRLNSLLAAVAPLLGAPLLAEASHLPAGDWREWSEIAVVKQEMGGTWAVSATEGADAFITEPGRFVGLVQDAVERETGVFPRLSTSGGTSDARFVKDYCPVLEFGPTNATIHQTDERIGVEELRATQAVYSRILEAYFSAEL